MAFFKEDKWNQWFDTLAVNDFVIIDNFLSPDLYSQVRIFFDKKLEDDQFHKAAIGDASNQQVVTSIRGDFTHWLDFQKDYELKLLWELIRETMDALNQLCFLSLSGFEFHLAHYPEGTEYKKHIDRFVNRSNRMISMIIYLNENWKSGDGGELIIFKQDKNVIVPPLSRRCVIFKSATVEHAVMKTHTGRDSITGWFLYYPSVLGPILG